MINFSNFKYVKDTGFANKRATFILFSIIGIFFISFILYFQIKQFTTLLSLRQDHYELDKYINKNKYIFDEKVELNKKLKNLENKHNMLFVKMFDIRRALKIILKNIPIDCCLHELIYCNNKIIMKGKSRSWTSLNKFISTINSKMGKVVNHKQQIDKELIAYYLELAL